jgi:selenocysteine lyase/cysteine desulfurase
VVVVPDDESGQLSVDALRDLLDDRVRLVAISWIPTQSGLVNPAAAVGALAREAGVPYLLDACQAVGQLPVDVDALGCDFLSATGRKYLRAPRGTGFLYVRRSRLGGLEPPFLDVHAARWAPGDEVEMRDDARRFESWEHSVANRLGLGAAVDYALALGVDAIAARIESLATSLRAQLVEVPELTLHDEGVERCGIVTFTIGGVDVHELSARLRTQAINISVSTIDFARHDFEARGLSAVARASVHYYNTDDELTRLVDAMATAPRA